MVKAQGYRLRMRTSVLVFMGLWAVVSCSSGDSGPGTSGVATCQGYCETRQSKNCPGEASIGECSADCSDEYSGDHQTCPAETDAWISCQAQALPDICDTYGIDEDYHTTVAACASQVQAYQVCTACVAEATDNPCKACSKTECCQERKDYYADPQTADYDYCKFTCLSQECDACPIDYPSAAAKAQATVDCAAAKCPSCASP